MFMIASLHLMFFNSCPGFCKKSDPKMMCSLLKWINVIERLRITWQGTHNILPCRWWTGPFQRHHLVCLNCRAASWHFLSLSPVWMTGDLHHHRLVPLSCASASSGALFRTNIRHVYAYPQMVPSSGLIIGVFMANVIRHSVATMS